MKVLLIDNYDSFTWNLVQMLEVSGLCQLEVRKNDKINLCEALEFDKVMISPGSGLPDEAGDIIALIRALAGKRSILGICLGHQAIARAYGACLVQSGVIRHGYASDIFIEDQEDTLFNDLPNPFKGGRYHSWVIDPGTLPANLMITAKDEEGNIMAIRHTIFDIKGLQFHPESCITSLGQQIVNNWLNF
jgi:anthranilate synthase component II